MTATPEEALQGVPGPSLADPRVSVVIPAFNRLAKTVRAVRSAQEQSLPPLEIIVVDDASQPQIASTDLPMDRVPVRLLRHETNLGGGAARNTGIDAAHGDWVAFLDSDDIWVSDKLAIQMHSLCLKPNQQAVVSACNVMVRRPGQHDRPYNAGGPKGSLSDWFLLDRGSYQSSGLVVSTQLARRTRFRDDLRRHQDWDFVLRLEKAGATFDYHEVCLVQYDSSDDHSRVSKSRSPDPTIYWFDTNAVGLSSRGKHQYYLYGFFWSHVRIAPRSALRRLVCTSFTYWQGPFVSLRYILFKAQRSFASRNQG